MSQYQALKIVEKGTHSDAIAFSEAAGTALQTRMQSCEKHGEYESRNVLGKIWTKCQQCTAEERAEESRIEADRQIMIRQYEWERKLGDSGIPERFATRTLESYKAATIGQKNALLFAQDYAAKFDDVIETGRCAVFCGKPGTGKTHLSIGIGIEIMKVGRLVLFTTVQRMMRRVKDTFKRDSEESETDVIKLFVRPDLLIIDEIGIQFGSDFEKNMMFDILNERYEKRSPTLLLSNLEPDEVKSFLGERVFDRLREDGGKCIPFDWESHRGKL